MEKNSELIRHENTVILNMMIHFADFLSHVLSKYYEIVIHKIDGDEISIAHIINGEVSGRDMNSPITDFAFKIINDGSYLESDYKVNYKGVSGNKSLKSSTFYIKNSENDLIGLFCINYDYNESKDALDDLYTKMCESLGIPSTIINNAEALEQDQELENLNISVKELISNIIDNNVETLGVTVERFTPHEKMKVVSELAKNNVFRLKGAINEVASQLHMSVATAYRYVSRVKLGDQDE